MFDLTGKLHHPFAGAVTNLALGGQVARGGHPGNVMVRVGKKAAGRELDGRTWDEYPEVVTP